MSARAWSVLGIGAGLGVAAWVASLLLGRINGLAASAYDLAFFEQIVWNVGHTGQWTSSFHRGSFLGLHFSPALVIPAVLQALVWDDVRVLSLIHAAGVGGLVVATFGFVRAVLRPSIVAAPFALGLALGIPAWGVTQQVILSDFHPELIGIALALAAGWAGLTGRSRLMWTLAVMACSTREDVAYAVGVVGLVVAARGSMPLRRQGRALAIAAIAWAVVVFGFLMPAIRGGGPNATSAYYAWLGSGLEPLLAPFTMTQQVVAALTAETPWFVVAGMLGAVAFLPLLRPRWLLLMGPPLAASLLSTHTQQADLTLQYPLILVVPLVVAAALGARRLTALVVRFSRSVRRRSGGVQARRDPRPAGQQRFLTLRMAPALIVLAAVLNGFLQGSIPPFDTSLAGFAGRPAAIDQARAAARSVPPDATLVADEGLVVPLAGRRSVRQLTSRNYVPDDAYVLFDRSPVLDGGWGAARRDPAVARLEAAHRAVLFDDGRFVLWGPRGGAVVP